MSKRNKAGVNWLTQEQAIDEVKQNMKYNSMLNTYFTQITHNGYDPINNFQINTISFLHLL